jgi:predicted  nucleic acid-binding Zn-ribbon protein
MALAFRSFTKAQKQAAAIGNDPRFKAVSANTRSAQSTARQLMTQVEQSKGKVAEMARRAEEIGRETAQIKQRTADARMHTESRMNMARKKFGKRAVAKVERKFAQGDRSLANAARQMGVFRAGG